MGWEAGPAVHKLKGDFTDSTVWNTGKTGDIYSFLITDYFVKISTYLFCQFNLALIHGNCTFWVTEEIFFTFHF